MLEVRGYQASDATAWDAVVEQSRNGNFLHRRAYMEYHADRFTDCSVVVEQGGKLVAVLPANLLDGVVTSHGGLTYGGLIATHDLRSESTLAAFAQIGNHYRRAGARQVVYKPVPHVFHAYPSEEDLYALQCVGARLTRRDISSVLPLRHGAGFSEARRRAIRKATRAGVEVSPGDDLAVFHALLCEVLRGHGAVPVHSVAELNLLRSRFPGHIVLHEARKDGVLVAGVLVYDFGHTVHTQYIGASEEGKRLDALSLLLGTLIGSVYADRTYFSFGVSTEQEGRVLNGGLIAQKESFGARGVVHDFYEWTL
ncbi:GNAT family N-acetyltransferase [Dyella telluris]|uniref:GNAT family N-acetyltransferase n=1 Tax=Dyella telluris TaxID=2763498 RepID=A0A7G8Q3C9_9GAMM|nr:GNAT family N-acetyltransferase [Dyella telluris]QNK01287.1 GNAT family N-acetyltransferase [Dyella telluris]